MILFLALGCATPGTLDSISSALADRAVTGGELSVRTATAIAGLLAETCGADAIEDHRFTSRSAAALRATGATVARDDTTQTWTFPSVGLDGTEGALEVVTDQNQENFAVTYVGGGAQLTAGIELRACDIDERAVVGGTGTWTTANATVGLTLLGAAPTNGLSFAPPTAEVPDGGQIRAEDDDAGWVILLDDASTLPNNAPSWPGTASGDGWEHGVTIAWP